jgi:hypothetical protein
MWIETKNTGVWYFFSLLKRIYFELKIDIIFPESPAFYLLTTYHYSVSFVS